MRETVRVPEGFREMPRWWRDGTAWLDALPGLAAEWCARWRLTVTGDPLHGSHALVVPVARDGELLVLRLTPPGPEVVRQEAALRFWAGRGTVRLMEADPGVGVMLLERLGAPLTTVPSLEAVAVLGRMMRRLAVEDPPEVESTAEIVARRMSAIPREWEHQGRPFDAGLLDRAMAAGARLTTGDESFAVNGDLHSAQVLRGEREPWLTADPVLLRGGEGDLAYDLARVLWTRLDEMRDDADIRRHLHTAARAAAIAPGHATDWVAFRAVDYWLWGLTAGLTEDPERCRRLLRAVIG